MGSGEGRDYILDIFFGPILLGLDHCKFFEKIKMHCHIGGDNKRRSNSQQASNWK